MLILVADTSHRTGTLGLVKDGRLLAQTNFAPIAEVMPTHCNDVLQSAGVTLTAIDLYVVTHGPGSFTGLRTGLTFIKTLAHLNKKPAVGISTLAAMARSADVAGAAAEAALAAIIHSSGEEYYLALYGEKENNTREILVTEQLMQLASLAALLKQPLSIIGEKLPPLSLAFNKMDFKIDSAALAQLGMESLQQQRNILKPESQPNYLRLSEVERRRGQESPL